MDSWSDETFKIDHKLGKIPRASIYELISSDYVIKVYSRKADGVNQHKILRLELTHKMNTSITEFTIADQFEMVLHHAKIKVDSLNKIPREATLNGASKIGW